MRIQIEHVHPEAAQILKRPELEKNLGNKNNLKLARLKKIYFNGERYRIVYEVVDNELIFIGKSK